MKEKSNFEEYVSKPYINQSLLKKLLIHPQEFKKELEKERDERQLPLHFLEGKLVDVLVTEPKLFDKYFYVLEENISKPSENIIKILYQLFDTHEEGEEISLDLSVYSPLLVELARENKYRSNIKNSETLLKYLLTTEIKEYWKHIILSNNKIVVTKEEYEKAEELANKIKELLFERFPESEWEYSYQVPVYARLNGVESKGLLDIVLTNKKENRYVIIDVKTTHLALKNFISAVKTNRLDIQSAFYTDLFAEDKFIQQQDIRYKISFYFIVGSKNTKEVSLFDAKNLYSIGKTGREPVIFAGMKIRKEIIGYEKLLDLYKFYTVNGFDVDLELIKNNFNIVLDWE